MKIRKSLIYSVIAFAVAFGILYSLQFSSSYILGLDGYFHTKMAYLMRSQGIVQDFPWTAYNIHSRGFADLHFLYHALLVPFTYIGPTAGFKWSTVAISLLTLFTFYAILKKEKVKKAYLWMLVLLLSSYPLLLRMNMGRLETLSFIFLILFVHYLVKQRYYAIAVVCYLFTLTYTLAIVVLPLSFVYLLVNKYFKNKWNLKILLYPFVGYLAGLLINPYFPRNIKLIHIQVFVIGLFNKVTVPLEWTALPLSQYLLFNLFIFLLIAFFGYLLYTKMISLNKMNVFLLAIISIFLMLSLESKRFILFLPLFIVWLLAVSISKIDLHAKKCNIIRVIGLLLILALVANALFSYDAAKSDIQEFQLIPGIYEASQWLLINTPEKSLVFTDEWYYFSPLFYFNAHNYYIYGLELNFGYFYEEKLLKAWLDIVNGEYSDPVPLIKYVFNTSYVIVTEQDMFFHLLENDNRSEKVFSKAQTSIFYIRDFPIQK